MTTAHILKHKETTMNDKTPQDNEPKPEPKPESELTPFQAMLASLDAAISSIDNINNDLRILREVLS